MSKGSSRQIREAAAVRRYLTLLADSAGNAKPGTKSIDTVASEVGVNASSLREYRDGIAEALAPSTVSLFAKLLGRPEGSFTGIEMDDSLGFADPSNGGWYGAMLAEESIRQARLRTYQLIDRSRPEAHSALHAWSDLAITGNIGEDTRYGGGFQPVVYNESGRVHDLMQRIEWNVNDSLLPDDQKLLVFRGMMKYGDQFGEVGLVQRGQGFDIGSVRPLHARTMYVHRNPDNFQYDPNYAYKQCIPGRTEPVAKFPEWKVVHFFNAVGWGDVYGESLFEPCLRSYIQIEAMEAGMLIRRLERAAMRYKHIIDVGLIDGGEEDIKKAVEDYRRRHKKVRTVDGSKNYRMQKISMPPEEDYIIPKRDKDSPADIEPMQGDAYIEEIGDVMHFWRKWMSGLGVPSAHLGYEDEGSKTGVNDKHIVFARRVRRAQLKFIAGLNHLYWVSLILKGIDPRTIKYTIFPPAMGTRDELIRAQIMMARATTVQYLSTAFGTTGEAPTPQWFLKYIMGMDEDVVKDLQLKKVMQTTKGNSGFQKNSPPKNVKDRKEDERMAQVALCNPAVIEQVDHLQFLLNERAIMLRLPNASIPVKWTQPFNVEEVAPTMGFNQLYTA